MRAPLALLFTASPAAHGNETMRLNYCEAGPFDGLLGELRQVVEREAEFLERRVDSRRPLLGVVELNGHGLASLATLGRERHSAGWTGSSGRNGSGVSGFLEAENREKKGGRVVERVNDDE